MTNKIINNRRAKNEKHVLLVRYTTKSGMRGKFVEAVMASGEFLDQIRKGKKDVCHIIIMRMSKIRTNCCS